MKMDVNTAVLVLLAASLVVAGPASTSLSLATSFDVLPSKVALEHMHPDFSSLSELSKSGGVPRIIAELKEDQVPEFETENGKGGYSSYSWNPRNCGKYPRYDRTGGKEENAPWLVLLGRRRGGRTQSQCVGVLVSDRHVVASAYCVSSNNVEFVIAPTSTSVTTVPLVTTNYIPGLTSTDGFLAGRNMVVLKLRASLTFSERLQPACLPPESATSDPDVTYTNTIVYGFRVNNGQLEKFHLRTETFGPVALYKLLEEFNRGNTPRKIQSIYLITGYHLGVVRGTSEEFVHTALFYRNSRNGRFYVLGIGPVAANRDEPVSLYTDIASHRRWVDQVLRQ